MDHRKLASFSIVLALIVMGCLCYGVKFQKAKPKPPFAVSAPKTKTISKTKIVMVRVPAGKLTMGSAVNGSEKAVRRVYLDGYWIGKFEVTVAQFRAYCKATGYKYDWKANKPDWGWIDNHPMVKVTWDEARAFCKWAGGDLPTEAQWEKAARGIDARVYPWGNKWDATKCSNSVESNNQQGTSGVGSHLSGASPYGCQDMAGNVWEWCLDWYGPYQPGDLRNPTGPGSGTGRVLRGGSWNNSDPVNFRGSSRNMCGPEIRYISFGFRVAGRL